MSGRLLVASEEAEQFRDRLLLRLTSTTTAELASAAFSQRPRPERVMARLAGGGDAAGGGEDAARGTRLGVIAERFDTVGRVEVRPPAAIAVIAAVAA